MRAAQLYANDVGAVVDAQIGIGELLHEAQIERVKVRGQN